MNIQLPGSKQGLFSSPRKITPAAHPVRSALDQVGVDEEEIVRQDPPVSAPSVTKSVNSTSFQVHYEPQSGLYFIGDRRSSCIIVGLGRGIPKSPEITMTVANDILQVASLVAKNPAYHLFVIDAPYQDAISCIDLIVQQPEGNGLYCHRRPLISIVDKGMEGLLPELEQRYAASPFKFIKAEKYGAAVIDAQLLGQPRY